MTEVNVMKADQEDDFLPNNVGEMIRGDIKCLDVKYGNTFLSHRYVYWTLRISESRSKSKKNARVSFFYDN